MGEGPETEGATGREGEDWLQSQRPRAHTRLPHCSQFTTTVVSCSPAELQTDVSGGKKEVLSGFHVVLEDTLLFPEGGGQVPGAASARPAPGDPHIPIRSCRKCTRPSLASVNQTVSSFSNVVMLM